MQQKRDASLATCDSPARALVFDERSARRDRSGLVSMPAVGPLYDELYAQLVTRPSHRYERLTAVVLAILGGRGIRHQKTMAVPTAPDESYVIDVVADDNDSVPVPLLVECRELSGRIERDDVLAHKAKADDLEAQAVMVTTVGYQKGAVGYARRHGIALVVLRRFDREDWERRCVALTATMSFPVVSAELHVDADSDAALETAGVARPVRFEEAEEIFEATTLLRRDGTAADNGLELLQSLGADREPGVRRLQLPESRVMTWRGVDITFDAVTWSVTSTPEVSMPMQIPVDAPDAELLCEVVVGGPAETSITRRQLVAYDFTSDGEVVERSTFRPPPAR